MTPVIRWTITILKYAAGVLGWMLLLSFLTLRGVFNSNSFVDGLWMNDLHDELVRNVTGEVALRAPYGYGDFGSGARYIYWAEYHHRGKDAAAGPRTLTSLVDVASWKWVRTDGITEIYADARYRYLVRTTSDGTDILAEDR